MEDFLKDKKGEEDIKQALSTGNFKLLYEYVIKQSFLKGEHQSNNSDGKWIKYEQGSDYNILRDSLQGYYTGWCTAAGENFAKDQLAGGDFYVYYSLDENGEAKVPRIAIRMDGKDKIGEIRGIADNQNMEPEMMPILEEKLKEFPDKDKYLKKEHDMKLLTLIDKKVNNNIELTLEELKFLYEIDDKISGFGCGNDPRIKEIKSKRNCKKDYAYLFNIKEEDIALSQEEWESNPEKFKFLFGDLHLSRITNADGLTLPRYIYGDLILDNLISSDGLVFPQQVNGNLNLNNLTSTEGLVLPQYVGRNIGLNSLTNADELIFPENIGGGIYLSSLANAEGLVLPESIGSDIYLNSLTNVDELILPKSVGNKVFLGYLTNAKRLVLPESIGYGIILGHLTNADGLVLPHGFDLNKLICPDNIIKEIRNNPDKYYMAPPSEEDKKGIKR